MAEKTTREHFVLLYTAVGKTDVRLLFFLSVDTPAAPAISQTRQAHPPLDSVDAPGNSN